MSVTGDWYFLLLHDQNVQKEVHVQKVDRNSEDAANSVMGRNVSV